MTTESSIRGRVAGRSRLSGRAVARRGFVLEVEPWHVRVRLDDDVWRVDRRRDIQAVRIAGAIFDKV